MKTIALFLILLPVFLVIDLVWLGVIMKSFYAAELGDLARRQGTALAPRWGAAILVYLLIPMGVVLFVRPLLGDNATLVQTFGWGALFGLILYGVYDLTNLAILDKWTLRMAIADIAWGCALCGTTSIAMRGLERWLGK
jgi:uncharacterized membrane protein